MQTTEPKRKFINLMDMELENHDQLQIYEFKGQDFEMVVSNQNTSEHLSNTN
jgi:hypothetical protein